MKSLITLILIFLSINLIAQEEYANQQKELLVKNNVFKIYKYDGTNKSLDYMIQLDKEGRPKKVLKPFQRYGEESNLQEIKERIEFNYDKGGNLIDIIDTTFSDPIFENLHIVWIDSTVQENKLEEPKFYTDLYELEHYPDGKVKTKIHYSNDGSVYYKKTYKYDPKIFTTQFFLNERIIQENTVEYEVRNIPKKFYGFDLDATKKTEHLYEYDNVFDDDGKLIFTKVKMKDVRGERFSDYVYEYDENDLLISETHTIYENGEAKFTFKESFEYEYY